MVRWSISLKGVIRKLMNQKRCRRNDIALSVAYSVALLGGISIDDGTMGSIEYASEATLDTSQKSTKH